MVEVEALLLVRAHDRCRRDAQGESGGDGAGDKVDGYVEWYPGHPAWDAHHGDGLFPPYCSGWGRWTLASS
jgi:hypothetical protein